MFLNVQLSSVGEKNKIMNYKIVNHFEDCCVLLGNDDEIDTQWRVNTVMKATEIDKTGLCLEPAANESSFYTCNDNITSLYYRSIIGLSKLTIVNKLRTTYSLEVNKLWKV